MANPPVQLDIIIYAIRQRLKIEWIVASDLDKDDESMS